MVKATIQIFCRVKPPRKKQTLGHYDIENSENGGEQLQFLLPKDLTGVYVNNTKESYRGRFQRIFDTDTKQEEVFDAVAKPVVENVLSGYNGTIFAYGQTGSGKTFTITGGPEKYADRGIIPRSISHMFQEFEKQSGYLFTLHVSYLEIYNNYGYDLLDPKHEISKLEDLPKVTLMEDGDQNVHLKNLSVHLANTEEEALNLLFLGDTNRMIAETPMNQASTRSHCIFTVHVSAREHGSATIKRAKLHLVDLAGSERVSKTNVNGKLLDEAKYINGSLHFLELVIISLSDKNRSHIPYRNSMMTNVLKDSLGGNCMTTMVATCSIEKTNIDESISTCRFAQRVALIKNDVSLNEELDPKLIIAKLKRETEELKNQLHLASGGKQSDEPLEEYEKNRCSAMVKMFIEDTDAEAVINLGADMRKINECFRILKQKFKKHNHLKKDDMVDNRQELNSTKNRDEKEERRGNSLNTARSSNEYKTTTGETDANMKRLQELVQQRDNEITILVSMLKKEKDRGSKGHISNRSEVKGCFTSRPDSGSSIDDKDAGLIGGNRKILGDLSVGRQQAFEIFKQDYPENQIIIEQKEKLKDNFKAAKELGEKVNNVRGTINRLKAQIEHYRVSLAMSGVKMDESDAPDETETLIRDKLENEKKNYRFIFAQLKELKSEIEHQQHLLEKSRVKLQKDFEGWWEDQVKRAENQKQLVNQTQDALGSSRAWMNPVEAGSHRLAPTPGNHFPAGAIPMKGKTKSRSLTPVQANSAPALESENTLTSVDGLDVPMTSQSSRSLPNTQRHPRHQLEPLENKSAAPATSAPAKPRQHDALHVPPSTTLSDVSTKGPEANSVVSDSGFESNNLSSTTQSKIPSSLYTPAFSSPIVASPSTSSVHSNPSSTDFPPKFMPNSIGSRQAPVAPKGPSGTFDIPLTGDPKADADIMAFIKARAKVKAAARERK